MPQPLTYSNTPQTMMRDDAYLHFAPAHEPVQQTYAEACDELERCGVTFNVDGSMNRCSLEEACTPLDLALVEHYGESMRPLLNESRIKYGMKPI